MTIQLLDDDEGDYVPEELAGGFDEAPDSFLEDLPLVSDLDEQAAADASEPQSSPNPEEDGVDDQKLDDDLELRLEVASLYKVLLGSDLFDEQSVAASTVKRRVRTFIRDELGVLLGIGRPSQTQAPVVVKQFTDEEESILKSLVAKVKGGVPATPAGTKAVTVSAAPARPASVLPKPKPKVVTTAPAPKPKTPAPPPQKPQAAPKPAPPKVQPATATDGRDGLLLKEGTGVAGEEIRTIRRGGRKIKQWVKNGRLINEQDLTEQRRPATAIPVPTLDQSEFVTMNAAQQSISSSMRRLARNNDRSAIAVIGDIVANGDIS